MDFVTETSNLGPLTSTYTLPTSCAAATSTVYQFVNGLGTQTTVDAFDDVDVDTGTYLLQGPTDASNCFPSGYNMTTSTAVYYSPGICPSGYTAACRRSVLEGGELTVTCCPTNRYFQCQSRSDHPWQEYLQCQYSLPESTWTITSLVEVSASATTTVSTTHGHSGGGINAYGVEVRVATTAYTGTSSPSQTSFSFGSSPDSTSDSHSKVSIGTAAGIGVGCGCGVVVVALLAFYVVRRMKRQGNRPTDEPEVTVA